MAETKLDAIPLEAGDAWRVEVPAHASLSDVSVVGAFGPTAQVLIENIREDHLEIALPEIAVNRVTVDGVPDGHPWMCSMSPENEAGSLQGRIQRPVDLEGADCSLIIVSANLKKEGSTAEFPSPVGQKWGVHIGVPEFEVAKRSAEHVETPSHTWFEVGGRVPIISLTGDLPSGTVLLLFDAVDPGSTVWHGTWKRTPGELRIDRLARYRTVRANRDYIIRCLLPSGRMGRYEFRSTAQGHAAVEFTGLGWSWTEPRAASLPSGTRAKRLYIQRNGGWRVVPGIPDDMSDVDGKLFSVEGDRDGASLAVWSDETWTLAYLVTSEERIARCTPGQGSSIVVDWASSREARLDPGALSSLDGVIYWQYRFKPDPARSDWLEIGRGSARAGTLGELDLQQYPVLDVQLLVWERGGSEEARDLAHAIVGR